MQENQTPEVNQVPVTPVIENPQTITTQVADQQPLPAQPVKTNNFLVGLLSVLLLLSVSIAGFFAYQTQNLVKELTSLRAVPTPTSEAIVEATQTPVATADPTASWETYSDTKNGFSIKYPATWRTVTGNFFGVGPKEVGEDILWSVNFYDVNTYSLVKIIDEQGKQFPDRKQEVNKINVGTLAATQIITTVPTITDWYLETIVVENAKTIFAIGNGAINNSNLQKMTGVPAGTAFKDFYTSFKFTN